MTNLYKIVAIRDKKTNQTTAPSIVPNNEFERSCMNFIYSKMQISIAYKPSHYEVIILGSYDISEEKFFITEKEERETIELTKILENFEKEDQ